MDVGKKIAIIGFGWVGKSMKDLFPDALIWDPATGHNDNVDDADVAFICVPTPNSKVPVTFPDDWCMHNNQRKDCEHCDNDWTGPLDISIVEECVKNCKAPLIVIRSTLNPGDSTYLTVKYHKRILVQPEYLGETPQHPMLDTKIRPFLIIGGEPADRRELVELYTTIYNANISIRQVSRLEAEVIKVSENRAIAFKVAQCQELYDACELAGVDYYTVRDAVYGDDFRFNLWWTFVYPNKRGMNSKCIPKDVYAWAAWAESLGYNPVITRAILKRNELWIKH